MTPLMQVGGGSGGGGSGSGAADSSSRHRLLGWLLAGTLPKHLQALPLWPR